MTDTRHYDDRDITVTHNVIRRLADDARNVVTTAETAWARGNAEARLSVYELLDKWLSDALVKDT